MVKNCVLVSIWFECVLHMLLYQKPGSQCGSDKVVGFLKRQGIAKEGQVFEVSLFKGMNADLANLVVTRASCYGRTSSASCVTTYSPPCTLCLCGAIHAVILSRVRRSQGHALRPPELNESIFFINEPVPGIFLS